MKITRLGAALITFGRRIRAASRNLWTRVLLISVLSLFAVLIAKLTGGLIPSGFAEAVGAESVTELLTIIANAMLAVTTFSLSVMVTIHRAVAGQWTPRAHQMLLRDAPMQTILATFVGAYIYALTSLILLSTPFFGEAEIVVLFGVTLVVIALIVAMILRWIMHLQTWGSLEQIASTIESAARRALAERDDRPCHGANPLTPDTIVPADAVDLLAKETGYVQSILFEKVAADAEEIGAQIYFLAPIGRFVHRGDVIGHMAAGNPALSDRIGDWITIGPSRTPDQDPRLCLIMLSEVGSKALSAGINDPGTAIDVIGRIVRLIAGFAPEVDRRSVPDYPNVWVPVLDPGDLVIEALAPLVRDGASLVEVQIVLQKRLAGLARHASAPIAKAATALAQDALAQANDAITGEGDRSRLAAVVKGDL
ncbi:DUF2254 domain-containing protein [Yoonia sp. 2307UL14-13]|uniref:DUF2254 domain-containing protein n=1 Tax=Yoonia sp. 2307UL14-13 TaxID=3126506 RepID=UPI0030A505C2